MKTQIMLLALVAMLGAGATASAAETTPADGTTMKLHGTVKKELVRKHHRHHRRHHRHHHHA